MQPNIRFANPGDAPTLWRFIMDLAIYEKEPDAVQVTPERLAAQMRQESPPFEALLIEEEGEAIGFALFFHTYSTWTGTRGIHLEDLYVPPEKRGQGAGKALLAFIANLAIERGCKRFEWAVLDWNEPAIRFYESLDAKPQDQWTVYRLTGASLEKLAEEA
jgi:GNAT superfamily N-acetyltransferase